MSERPAIPEPLKREIRQRDGFGCVLCGCPLYVYEHFEEFSKVKEHTLGNIYLLCDTHHREKEHLLPLEKIETARKSPRNRKAEFTHLHPLHYFGDKCVLKIGSSTFRSVLSELNNSFSAIVVENEEIFNFRFEDGHILFTTKIYDPDGNLVVHILDNQLLIKTENWDVEFIKNRLTIRHAPSEIAVEIAFDPPSNITFLRGTFYSSNGYPIQIKNEKLLFNHGIDGTFVCEDHDTSRKYCIVVNSDRRFGDRCMVEIDNRVTQEYWDWLTKKNKQN